MASRELHFTKPALDRLPPAAAGKRDYYRDDNVQGLQLVVTERGAKSFVLYRRIKGRPTRVFLGGYPALTPENARHQAERLRGRIAMGEDVVTERRAVKARSVTLREAFAQFRIVRARLKPRTLYDYQRYLDRIFADWCDRPIVEITKDRVAARHLALSRDSGPAYADGAMRFLRSVINFANAQYEAPDGTPLLPDNPVRRLSQTRGWNRSTRRTTVIVREQLGPWFAAVLTLKAEPAQIGVPDTQGALVADYLLLLMLTGLRRSEGAQLKWADISFTAKTLTLRDTKNREDHTLPVSDFLFDILATRRAITTSEFAFPGPGARGFLTEPRAQIQRVIAASGVKFMLHDLRRTFITVAESLDTPAYALKRLLNHKMRQDVTAGYIITDVERLRKPMQAVTDFVLKQAGLRATASVTPLHPEKAS